MDLLSLPKFVKLNSSALRLDGDYYVRDAGQWIYWDDDSI